MKKISLLLLLMVASSLISGCGQFTNTGASFDPSTTLRFKNLMDTTRATVEAQGMIMAVWVPGKGEYIGLSGTENIETGAPMDPLKLFRAGSITKTFVGTVVLQLVDEGIISLDDTVDMHIAGVPNGGSITIKMLLNHSSGLPNYTANDAFWSDFYADRHRQFSRQELLDYAYVLPMQAAPGVEYHYSNTNTTLLGMIIEKYIPGETLDQSVKRRVIDVIGLKNTSFATLETFPGEYLRGYQKEDSGIVDWSIYNPSWMWAAGAIISNIYDLKTYIKSISDNEHALLSPALQSKRINDDWMLLGGTVAPTLKYGLGWAQIGGFYFHDGSTSGYHSLIGYDPSTGTTVAMIITTEPEVGAVCVSTLIEIIKILYPERAI